MGLGKAIMLQLTQVVKCDWCGNIIMDARHRSTGSISADLHGGAGPTLFETIKYSSKKHNFCCNMCETAYKMAHGEDEPKKSANKSKKQVQETAHDPNEELERAKWALAAQMAIAEERHDDNLVQRISAELKSVGNVRPQSVAQANFCSHCGGALKQNARFCSKCGSSVR